MLFGREAERINEQQQLEHMIESYQNLIYTICYKFTNNYFDAEDLTQETFLSAYRNLSKFDGENLKAWLCKIAKNKCLDHLKRAEARSVPTEDSFFLTLEAGGQNDSPEKICLEESVREQLRAACNSLSPPYDEVALAYFYEERSIEELAVSLDRNDKTIRTQIFRAKGMLRKILDEEDFTDRHEERRQIHAG